MPPPSFQDCLASIAAKNGSPPPAASYGAYVADWGPTGTSHKERLARAMVLAESRGLPRRKLMPPAYWPLIRLGIPIRPQPFMTVLGLFLSGALVLPMIFGPFLAFGLFESSERALFRLIHWLGWPGTLGLALVMGIMNPIFARREACRYGLPPWDEV